MRENLKTISFFKEIAKIPRESGNEEKIADYLCQFAKDRKLDYQRDKYHNVVIYKKTCDKSPVILQVHTDMVCEKEAGKDFDFFTGSIEVIEENGYLRANGTTLGADNGIGIAQILSVLDSDLPCNIEAVFTVSEETSMIGAIHFDTSQLHGKMLLNLDGFEEDMIVIESACFYDIILKSNYIFENNNSQFANKEELSFYEITITNMPGGHSGTEIDKQNGNSSIELAKILSQLSEIKIAEFTGGTKFNVIPSEAKAIFTTTMQQEELQKLMKTQENILREKFPKIELEMKKSISEKRVLNVKDTQEFLQSILQFPHGVIKRNEKGEVTTSVNLGVVDLKKQEMKVGMRSSRKEEELNCVQQLQKYSSENGLQFSVLGSQPGFESNEKSKLVQTLLKTYPNILKETKRPEIKAMHFTVEVGFFQEKIPDLQIAIISPNIQGAHTTKECVEIASIARTDEWIWSFLEQY